jgi:6-phosphogluconolactonase
MTRYAYIGTYTASKPGVDHRKEGIQTYYYDQVTGKMVFASTVESGINPSFLAFSPDNNFLFSVNEKRDGGVSAFSIEPVSGQLTRLNGQPTNGADPCYLSTDPDGRWLLTANYSGGSLVVHPILADGRLGQIADFVQHQGSGPNKGRQEKAHAHSIRFGPGGKYVLAADLGLDQVLVYRLDATTGKLSLHGQTAFDPGFGPRHFDYHINGRFIYVAGELGNQVTACTWDAEKGVLTPFQSLNTLPDEFTGESTIADIHVHPNGRLLYLSNRGDDSLAIYSIDPQSGSLSLVGHEPTRGGCPRNFAIDPSGDFLLAANQYTDNVVVFRIDAENGKLTFTGDEYIIASPVCVRFLDL